MNQVSEKLSEQALVVYKALHEQVASLKKQQWTITNYLLLLYAAVFAIKRELSSSSSNELIKWFSVATVAFVGLYGVAALVKVQYDVGKARERVDNTNSAIFGTTESTALGLKRECFPFLRGLFFTGALVLVLLFGALITIFYLLN